MKEARVHVDVGHVTAIRVLGPVKGEGGNLVVLPCIDRVERCLTPVKGLMRFVICGPVDKDDEFLILWPDEALANTVANEFAECVVVAEHVDKNDGCAIVRRVRQRERELLRARLTFIMDIKLVPGDDFEDLAR